MRIVGSAERNRHERRPREGGDPGRTLGLSRYRERREPNCQATRRFRIHPIGGAPGVPLRGRGNDEHESRRRTRCARIGDAVWRIRHDRRPREGGDPGRRCALFLTQERRKPNGHVKCRSGILQSQDHLDSSWEHAGMTIEACEKSRDYTDWATSVKGPLDFGYEHARMTGYKSNTTLIACVRRLSVAVRMAWRYSASGKRWVIKSSMRMRPLRWNWMAHS